MKIQNQKNIRETGISSVCIRQFWQYNGITYIYRLFKDDENNRKKHKYWHYHTQSKYIIFLKQIKNISSLKYCCTFARWIGTYFFQKIWRMIIKLGINIWNTKSYKKRSLRVNSTKTRIKTNFKFFCSSTFFASESKFHKNKD